MVDVRQERADALGRGDVQDAMEGWVDGRMVCM